MAEFIDVQQNSDEWFRLRLGRVGGSSMVKIMANYGKSFGDPAKNLAIEAALQQITGLRSENDKFSNSHMERGHIQEKQARLLYEMDNFCTVSNGGYFIVDDLVGISPDGIVEDGGIEIKSVLANIHYANIKRGSMDPTYKWQVYAEMKYTGAEWWDFVSYCVDFPPGKKLCTYRVYREDLQEEFKMIDTRIDEFRVLVNDAKKVILG